MLYKNIYKKIKICTFSKHPLLRKKLTSSGLGIISPVYSSSRTPLAVLLVALYAASFLARSAAPATNGDRVVEVVEAILKGCLRSRDF